jgi:hypothetical protein
MRLREKHDLLQATYEEALGTLKDPTIVDNVACAPNSTIDQALLIEENKKLKEKLEKEHLTPLPRARLLMMFLLIKRRELTSKALGTTQ